MARRSEAFVHPRVVVRSVVWAAITGMLSLALAALALGITPDSLSMRWQSGTADDHTLHYMVATAAGDSPFFLPNDCMGFFAATAVRESGACAVQVDDLAYTDDLSGWRPFVAAVADSSAPALESTENARRFALFTVAG